MSEGPQNIISRRLALAFESGGRRAGAPTMYFIVNGTVSPVEIKGTDKHRWSGGRDPVMGVRKPSSFKVSIPMAALLDGNGLGELLLAQFGSDVKTQCAPLDTAGYHTSGANPSTDISGGSDNSFKIKVDGASTWETVALTLTTKNTGAKIATEMQSKIRAKGGAYATVVVAYVGTPPTNTYLITSGSVGATSAVTITDAVSASVADELKIGSLNGGADTAGTANPSGARDHVFTATDTPKSFTLWIWDTRDPLSVRFCVNDTMKIVADKAANSIDLTFDVIGAGLESSSTFGSASYINDATEKPNMIPPSQSILEYGQPQSSISTFWNKLRITQKGAPAYGGNHKAPVPSGSSEPRLVAWGNRDTDIQIDFVDEAGEERKRWREGVDTAPSATAQQDTAGLVKFRWRAYGSKIGSSVIWGYAHQSNAGTLTASWGGTYTGGSVDHWEVVATATDTFKWRKNDGDWTTGVAITGAAQSLGSDGVTITFSGTTGAAINDTFYGFSHYQRMIEFCSLTNVIEDVNDANSTTFYLATVKLFHESGPSGVKPTVTLRNTYTSTYS